MRARGAGEGPGQGCNDADEAPRAGPCGIWPAARRAVVTDACGTSARPAPSVARPRLVWSAVVEQAPPCSLEFTPVALGWPAGMSGLASIDAELFGQPFPPCDALGMLAEKLARLSGGASACAGIQHLDLIFVRRLTDTQTIPGTDALARFRACAVDRHMPGLHRLGGKTPGFEKAREPEPFVDSLRRLGLGHGSARKAPHPAGARVREETKNLNDPFNLQWGAPQGQRGAGGRRIAGGS